MVFAIAVAEYTINAVLEQISYGRSGQVYVAQHHHLLYLDCRDLNEFLTLLGYQEQIAFFT